jgi:hypothetical protein
MVRHLGVVLAVCVFAVALAGCDAGPTSTQLRVTPTPSFTALHVVRTSLGVTPHPVSAFEETVTRVGDIDRLYAEIWRLGTDFAEGSSPLDAGINYELTFLQGSRVLLAAVVAPGGLGRVILANCRILAIHTDTFWSAFFAATGLTEDTLFGDGGWSATAPPYAPRPSLPTALYPFVPHACKHPTPTPTSSA